MESEISKINNGICPLCKQESEFITLDFGRKRKFNCPNCTQFLISSSSEKALSELDKSIRDKLSKESKSCKDGTMLHIYIKENKPIIKHVLKSNWF